MWALLTVIFSLTLLGSLLSLFFKKVRRKAKWIAPLSVVGLVISAMILGKELDESSRQKGFLSATDFRQAEKAGIIDPAQWRAQRETVEAAGLALVETKRNAEADAESRRAELLRPPYRQLNFISAIERGRTQFKSGQNDLQKGAARPSRAKEICAALPEAQLKGWIGTVATLSTNSDGDAVVSIKIADKLHLVTWNNSFSDIGAGTLIKSDSPLYRTLLGIKIGEPVRLYGLMFSSDQDCYRETSLTLSGSVLDPTFLVLFSQINRVDLP